MREFTNLKQGKLSAKEYDLKFTLFSNNAPSLVANPRDLMNRFMMGVFELVEEEYRMAMLVDDMDISQLIVFSRQIDESKIKKEKRRIRMKNEGSDEK